MLGWAVMLFALATAVGTPLGMLNNVWNWLQGASQVQSLVHSLVTEDVNGGMPIAEG